MRLNVRWWLIGGLWTAYLALIWFLCLNSRFAMYDFSNYYAGAGDILAGMNPYLRADYLYPPLWAQMLIPLVWLGDYAAAWRIWLGINLILLGITLMLLSSFTPRKQRWIVWMMPVVCWVLVEALVIGQATILMLILIAGAWAALKRRHDVVGGVLIALAIWIKVYPALFIVYLLIKREKRPLFAAMSALIGFGLVQVLILGWSPFTAFFNSLITLSSGGQESLVHGNNSILGFVSRLFVPSDTVQILMDSPALYWISRIGLSGLIVLGSFYFAAKSPAPKAAPQNNRDWQFDLEWSLILIASFLLSPTFWVSGMPPLLLSYFLLWSNRPLGEVGKWIGWFCFFACILLSLYYVFILGYAPQTQLLNGWALSGGFFIMVATWMLHVYLLARPQRGIDERSFR